jgi:acetate kinase
VIDQNKNYRQGNRIREINCSDSKVKVMVLPTNEELKIAQETKKVIEDK